jgi:FixJ family two-component response regulator/anti-sigma regulatory factor (Ser/Thr protein kinase)/putative methionine-R-sulfoxide reductase with GAF domain
VYVNFVSADDPAAAAPANGDEGFEVVLIEDSQVYAQAVKTMLDYPEGGAAFTVTHFTKLADALAYVPTAAAACLLVDLNLPDATGIEAVNALQEAAPLVPIVVLTGLDDDRLALDAMHAGAQDYLVKSRVDVDLITRSIRYAMERARSERHRAELAREQVARAEAEELAGTITRLERLTEAALANLPLDELLHELLGHVCDLLQTDTAAILLLDEERQVLEVKAERGLHGEAEVQFTVPVGAGFAGRIVSERRSIVIDDISQAEVLSPILRQRVKSLLGVPLLAEDRIIGVMHVGTTGTRQFTAEDTVVLQLAADRAGRAIERARRFQQEHDTAVTLQRSLLPDRLPDVPGLALAARYLPGAAGTEVGGDWYDVILLADGRVGIVMGDVVGRGIPAASLVGQLRNGLRAYAIEGHSPAAALERLDRLVQSLNPGRMATLLYMVLEPDGRNAVFANAGHLPPLVVEEDGTPRLLDGPRGVPLGVLPYASFEEAEARLEPASTMVLYTDGLVEERGISIEIRLDDLQRVASRAFDGPNELCDRLVHELLPDGPGADDVALLAMTTAPASTDRLVLTLPAEPEALITARRALRNWLAEVGVDPEALYDITLATGEACTNAIEHAYAPGEASFDLEATRGESDVLVTVRDYGAWREPRGQNRGRGLKLMKTLMDAVDVRREDTGTTVQLRRVVQGDSDAG